MRSKPACWSLSLAGARYSSSSSSTSSSPSSLSFSHSLSVLPHLLQCVFRHVQAKPLPLRNSLCLFLLSFPLLFHFLDLFFFFCPTRSYILTHFFMLLSCHIIGPAARIFDKIAGVTLHCLDSQTKDQALDVSMCKIYASLRLQKRLSATHASANLKHLQDCLH